MMKVLCIHDGAWTYEKPIEELDSFGPIFNEICTVIDTEIENGTYYYILAEYYRHPATGNYESFGCKWFIPLSEIDEKDMVREHQTEKV